MNRRSRNLVEARGLVLAALLAALAGMVDVIGYLHLNGLFVSYMSGNSTQLAAALGRGDPGGTGSGCSCLWPPQAKCWPITPADGT
jgi:hypothetical protein